MEPSPKTTCTRCGTSILQITADLTGGHCMPCANAMARAKEPVTDYVLRRNPEPVLDHLHPAEDVIISVDYHPGWSPDLTSWVIQISNDGMLRQAISWHRKRGREAELLEPVTLKLTDLAAFQLLIESCSPDSFRSLADAACVDDAAMVSLIMPGRNVKVELPYFHLEHDLKRGSRKFEEMQASSFQLFGQLWRFADRHAPYSLRDREKRQ
jgi:hypothetical protein